MSVIKGQIAAEATRQDVEEKTIISPDCCQLRLGSLNRFWAI